MKRANILTTQPDAYKAIMALENYVISSEIDPIHKELIKLRSSQINGCAYCLDMHSRDARKLGETEQRIYTLSAWRDTPFFDEKEQAILALKEEVTLINKAGVSDETYNKATELLGAKYVGQVILAIVIINAWNRISISSHFQPALQK
ncbi:MULTISPECIES: carboxymuconolactone decarboxylase family protein [unclassified Mucilaginibacter]|uniref:carboxymuconolactone decarboxylase family protein n=1 Tax=unclassified Mucilaginibacter TaxID=2617802 RepID=UPI002AC9BBA4|nr:MULTISPECIES: carboxymuconolactone decarboxylase family protein [unclassified Mucilaginibacter]MEB0263051.1 carboxymuconolactone decarboxylase family protein [Mucilaginibacter sp. 10I4]MEB0277903.1 carboxymuconolactone decarboxylase family protein [Mucilaginibacter sp. 10B2]MEB0302007.1 carboxymuconolactone decarboxylase family protein [Mucilaginibacter sp. 5C4]WPX22794.1 carboxymuconolactone decarboxylase family protein [Mucilaginibacter sp. 5C4]